MRSLFREMISTISTIGLVIKLLLLYALHSISLQFTSKTLICVTTTLLMREHRHSLILLARVQDFSASTSKVIKSKVRELSSWRKP